MFRRDMDHSLNHASYLLCLFVSLAPRRGGGPFRQERQTVREAP